MSRVCPGCLQSTPREAREGVRIWNAYGKHQTLNLEPRTMLIRLVPNGGFSVRQRRAAPGVVKRVIGRRLRHRSDAEQAPEGVEREEPPVEAERKLVQVRLKVLRRDAVVNAIQPG